MIRVCHLSMLDTSSAVVAYVATAEMKAEPDAKIVASSDVQDWAALVHGLTKTCENDEALQNLICTATVALKSVEEAMRSDSSPIGYGDRHWTLCSSKFHSSAANCSLIYFAEQE